MACDLKLMFPYVDIDECTNGPNDCDVNFECVNTPGSFTCECPTGFEINEGNCEGEPSIYVNVMITST